MEKDFLTTTTEHGSREWQVFQPMKNDRISMFGTPYTRNTRDPNKAPDVPAALKYRNKKRFPPGALKG